MPPQSPRCKMDDVKETKTKAKMYRVSERFLRNEQTPVTLCDGVAVCLCARDLVKEIPGTLHSPPKTVTVKSATQAQLKKLFSDGHELIEEYDA